MDDETFDYGGDYGGDYGDGGDYGGDYEEDFGDGGDEGGELYGGEDSAELGQYSGDGGDEGDMDPEDILENAWLTAKEVSGSEQDAQLKKLLEREAELLADEKTKFGLKSLKRLSLNAFTDGHPNDILGYIQTMVKAYKQPMRENMQSITALLEKLSEYKESLQIIDLVLDVVTPKDSKTRVKLYLLKAKGMAARGVSEEEIEKVLSSAHELCRTPDGSDNVSQSSLLLDIYGLKISRAVGNHKLLKSLFEKSLPLTTAGLASNAVLGVIYRCGGISRMRDQKYAEASQHFFDAFKNFDECRNMDMSVECLKLLVFTTLLGGSKVNPFDDKRASSHVSKQEIKNFERLVKDVLSKNIENFERSIRPMMRDDLVSSLVPELRKLVQKDVFLDMVRPYSNLSLSFIAKKIHASEPETEGLLVELILDRRVAGSINQRAGILTLTPSPSVADNYYESLYGLSRSVCQLTKNVMLQVH